MTIVRIRKPTQIQFHKVESSNIKGVAWHDDVLYVEFHHGGIYAYENVKKRVFVALLDASSVGGYFAINVRNNYVTQKIK